MLIETQYLTNSKKLVVSYVDKSGDIKLKYYNKRAQSESGGKQQK
jgi:hypothetical protein